VKLTCPVQTKD